LCSSIATVATSSSITRLCNPRSISNGNHPVHKPWAGPWTWQGHCASCTIVILRCGGRWPLMVAAGTRYMSWCGSKPSRVGHFVQYLKFHCRLGDPSRYQARELAAYPRPTYVAVLFVEHYVCHGTVCRVDLPSFYILCCLATHPCTHALPHAPTLFSFGHTHAPCSLLAIRTHHAHSQLTVLEQA
jgi:hypothetical protein